MAINTESSPLLPNSVSHSAQDKPTIRGSLKALFFSSKFNLLLIFVPLSLAFSYGGAPDTVVFSLNFMAIMPLAKLLGFGKLIAYHAVDVSIM